MGTVLARRDRNEERLLRRIKSKMELLGYDDLMVAAKMHLSIGQWRYRKKLPNTLKFDELLKLDKILKLELFREEVAEWERH